jgi:hypothetical protein
MATASLEMTADVSKDIVVPFVKRAPKRRRKRKGNSKATKDPLLCFSPEELQASGLFVTNSGEIVNASEADSSALVSDTIVTATGEVIAADRLVSR